MDQRALASGGKILRRNGDGKGRYLVSGRDQRAQPSADGRERSGARRSELHGRPRFCAARRATAAGRSPGGGVASLGEGGVHDQTKFGVQAAVSAVLVN